MQHGGNKNNCNNPKKSWSSYKQVQVRCKKCPIENISSLQVVDFNQPDEDSRIKRLRNYISCHTVYQGPLYGLQEYPGFMFCPQAICSDLHLELAHQAVTKYCEKPHATNIDLVARKPDETENTSEQTMWKLWKEEAGFVGNTDTVTFGASGNDDGCLISDDKEREITIKNTTRNKHKKRKTNRNGTAATGGVSPKKKYYYSFSKLSWATTGYHYDWTKRCYHEGAQSPMPSLLQNLGVFFGRTALAAELDCHKMENDDTQISSANLQFTPTASIVNYYTPKSVMGGHVDDLEEAVDKPVVSVSLGLPAIFLLGGKTKDDAPIPILVRAGDVMMLGGDSRLNMHGMARVLPADSSFATEICPKPQLHHQVTRKTLGYATDLWQLEEVEELQAFLAEHRINMNVRQVYKD